MARHDPRSPQERALQSRMAAHLSHVRHDPRERTEPMRQGLRAKWERLADPDGTLSPDERERRVRHYELAHYEKMRLAKARKARERRELDALFSASTSQQAKRQPAGTER